MFHILKEVCRAKRAWISLLLRVYALWFSIGFLHIISIISFHLWCMHGGHVWIWKKILFQFVEGQNKFDLQMNWYRMFFQTSTLPPSMGGRLTEHGRCSMQNSQLATKSHFELEITLICQKSLPLSVDHERWLGPDDSCRQCHDFPSLWKCSHSPCVYTFASQ